MIKKIIVTVLFAVFFGNGVFAQMATAQKIVWDIDVKAEVNASQSTVWSYLNNVEKLKQFSNGFVKSIQKKGEVAPVSVNVHFSNGKKRYETITQLNNRNKFMTVKINNESLPKGVKNAEIGIFTESESDEKTTISWYAKITGDKKGKKILMNQLNSEFEAYRIGFGNLKGVD